MRPSTTRNKLRCALLRACGAFSGWFRGMGGYVKAARINRICLIS